VNTWTRLCLYPTIILKLTTVELCSIKTTKISKMISLPTSCKEEEEVLVQRYSHSTQFKREAQACPLLSSEAAAVEMAAGKRHLIRAAGIARALQHPKLMVKREAYHCIPYSTGHLRNNK